MERKGKELTSLEQGEAGEIKGNGGSIYKRKLMLAMVLIYQGPKDRKQRKKGEGRREKGLVSQGIREKENNF